MAKKTEPIDLHQKLRDTITKLAASGEIRSKAYMIDEAYQSLTSDDLHRAARETFADMSSDGSITKVGGRYRVGQMGTGIEEVPELSETDALSRSDTSRPPNQREHSNDCPSRWGDPCAPYCPMRPAAKAKKGRRS